MDRLGRYSSTYWSVWNCDALFDRPFLGCTVPGSKSKHLHPLPQCRSLHSSSSNIFRLSWRRFKSVFVRRKSRVCPGVSYSSTRAGENRFFFSWNRNKYYPFFEVWYREFYMWTFSFLLWIYILTSENNFEMDNSHWGTRIFQITNFLILKLLDIDALNSCIIDLQEIIKYNMEIRKRTSRRGNYR